MWPASVVYLLLGTIISRGTNALPNTAVEVPTLADAIHKIENTTTELKSLLSSRASVKLLSQSATASRTRWSSFDTPQPKYVVKVQNEQDVANVIKYCTSKDIKFLVQNGGSGWATTFNLGQNGVLIDMAQMNQFILSLDKTQATIGGGAIINETIQAAYNQGVVVVTGNCNCVGTLGALLGGGYGNLMGLYGFAIDNVISLRVVLPSGDIQTITKDNSPDLFWALRGAGPNFGVITSATVRSYNIGKARSVAWTGAVIFSSDKIEKVVSVINDLELEPEMNIFLYYSSSGPPSNTPVVLTTPFLFGGTNATGHQKFKKLYDIGPMADQTAVVSYPQFGSGADSFCIRGARKPSYGAGLSSLVPATWREIWNYYVDFQKQPGAEESIILMERYSLAKARSIPSDSAAFPYRSIGFNAVAISWYTDPALDGAARAFGSKTRDAWRRTDGFAANSTYVNFAYGDEEPSVVYGTSLPRLQKAKTEIDPGNVFNQWFNIK